MATFTFQHPELLSTLEKMIFKDEYEQEAERFPDLFNVKTSNKAYEDAMRVSGLGTFALKAEGAPIGYDDPVSGPRRRVTHSTYALGFRLTMEMRQDEQFGIMEQMPRDLARSARDHRDNLAWNVLNVGFTAGTYGLDGLQLFATNHPYLKTQGTATTNVQSNMLAPPVALSVTGIEAMLTMARTVRDDSGRFTPISVQTLVIPPALEHVAYQLLESQFEPGGNNNDVNTVQRNRIGVSTLVVPYLSDVDNWFLFASKANHGLYFWNRMPVTFTDSPDFDTKDHKYDACYRAVTSAWTWRGSWGSNP